MSVRFYPATVFRFCPNGPGPCSCTGACLRDYDQLHRPLNEMFAKEEDGRFAVPADRLYWVKRPCALRPEDV
jgi:hypothetical protein